MLNTGLSGSLTAHITSNSVSDFILGDLEWCAHACGGALVRVAEKGGLSEKEGSCVWEEEEGESEE